MSSKLVRGVNVEIFISNNKTAVPDRQHTNVRQWVMVFAGVLAFITYVDRVAIAEAAPFITTEFKLTPVEMGYVLSAFGWSYAIFEVPAGWFGDLAESASGGVVLIELT